jgi:NAD(P)-dependent dehydrogenase (short-subunit alcohol dehydrogenase family)
MDLSAHTAIVTGAGAGIGEAIAVRLAEAGAAVVVHYRSNAEGAERVAADITEKSGRACAIRADLTEVDGARGLVTAAVDRFGPVSLLVNNAGIYPSASILDMPIAQWNEVLAANLTATHLVTQAFAAALPAGTRGAIVNIASIEAGNVAPMHSHYVAAKAGVVMYTKAAARELGPRGIRVNVVSPGLIWREGLDEAWPDGVARYRRAAPLGRLGEAGDVADACVFLLSDGARWITGAELVVDGGVLTSTAY